MSSAATQFLKLHYVASSKHLLQKPYIPSKSTVLKHLSFLDPSNKNIERSCHDLLQVAKALPDDIPTYTLQDEWKLLQREVEDNHTASRVDDYWNKYISIELPGGKN